MAVHANADEAGPPETAGEMPPAGDVRGTAEAILRWAKENRLFARQPMEDAADAVIDEDADVVPPPQEFTVPAVADVLRRRAINLVAFNEKAAKVIIFTKTKLTVSDLKMVPPDMAGVEIEYTVGGVAAVKGSIPQTQGPQAYYLHNQKYCCGSSIFPANCVGAGTFGFLAYDTNNKLFGVSNNHVTGACNHAHPGLPILAPGPLDVSDEGIDPFCLGRHSRLVPINDGIPENMDITGNIDAASFSISDPTEVCSMQGNLCDTPMAVDEPHPNDIIEKVGRTTGFTRGRIVGQAISPIPVTYGLPEYRVQKSVFFSNIYICQGLLGDFAKRGDSGALVMCYKPDGTRVSVGLVFAVDEQRSLTYVVGLPGILTRLGLTICGGFNVQ